ncbi:hypothetical protein HOY34_01880 [Xinfangfangia sp. D13-10-4-6]|uniref:DUF4153 domain-containing protein n=1 Tax=Pseudogemmobacter hezensis TaxID=2737662 RepID=UPI001554AD10|nr:DUF4153 domain-containing protein [Pseudogemmobacter hezensis]NPD13947.1 hypothetical protein [Pseudogemmobacter hezensis]
MLSTVLNRWFFALLGGAAGFALWQLHAIGVRAVDPHLTTAASGFVLVFAWAFYAMAGPLRIREALGRALPLAALTGGLMLLMSMRWPLTIDIFETPGHLLAMLAVAIIPVPFLLAEMGVGSDNGAGERAGGSLGRWNAYPALFGIVWGITTRVLIALFFTLAVWLVVALSAFLLDVVGVTLIDRLLMRGWAAPVISGLAFGLAVAVVNEMVGTLPARVIHWLLRLLLPVVTLVSLVFAGALLIWGVERNFGGISLAFTMLAMAAAGIVLVTVALDADDAHASRSLLIRGSARVMAVLIAVLAGLALWAVGIRIADQGLMPNRLFVLFLAIIGLIYGLAYTAGLLRGRGFAGWIRAANPWLALLTLLAAVLWQTPLLNAESWSAQDQAQRIIDGRKPASTFSRRVVEKLGIAGAQASQRVLAHARETGNSALEAEIQNQLNAGYLPQNAYAPVEISEEAMRQKLVEQMPIIPALPAETRAGLIDRIPGWFLENHVEACARRLPSGKPACLMLVADLLPEIPGDEIIVLAEHSRGLESYAIYAAGDSYLTASLLNNRGAFASRDELLRNLVDWSEAAPPLVPAPVMQLGEGSSGLFFVP